VERTRSPVSAKELAQALPEDAWRRVTWREGSKAPLASRFTAVRVRPAHRDYWRSEPRAAEWFLIEWPNGGVEPTKYWLSTLPEDTKLATLVDQAKLRWRIERDYQELQQEIGLGHYEGRGWRGFHHHATLSIAAHGFLVSERSLIPPQPQARRSSRLLRYPKIIDPAVPPLRPERHVANSIPTIRIRLAHALARRLPRCPCCQRRLMTQ
jgi:SRSO17 transposase